MATYAIWEGDDELGRLLGGWGAAGESLREESGEWGYANELGRWMDDGGGSFIDEAMDVLDSGRGKGDPFSIGTGVLERGGAPTGVTAAAAAAGGAGVACACAGPGAPPLFVGFTLLSGFTGFTGGMAFAGANGSNFNDGFLLLVALDESFSQILRN